MVSGVLAQIANIRKQALAAALASPNVPPAMLAALAQQEPQTMQAQSQPMLGGFAGPAVAPTGPAQKPQSRADALAKLAKDVISSKAKLENSIEALKSAHQQNESLTPMPDVQPKGLTDSQALIPAAIAMLARLFGARDEYVQPALQNFLMGQKAGNEADAAKANAKTKLGFQSYKSMLTAKEQNAATDAQMAQADYEESRKSLESEKTAAEKEATQIRALQNKIDLKEMENSAKAAHDAGQPFNVWWANLQAAHPDWTSNDYLNALNAWTKNTPESRSAQAALAEQRRALTPKLVDQIVNDMKVKTMNAESLKSLREHMIQRIDAEVKYWPQKMADEQTRAMAAYGNYLVNAAKLNQTGSGAATPGERQKLMQNQADQIKAMITSHQNAIDAAMEMAKQRAIEWDSDDPKHPGFVQIQQFHRDEIEKLAKEYENIQPSSQSSNGAFSGAKAEGKAPAP